MKTNTRARLLALHDRFTLAEFGLAGVALAVLLGAYLCEVVSRYAFNTPTRWSSDLVQYALCVSVALALPMVTKDGGHVAITSFLEKLKPGPMAQATRAIVWLGAVSLAFTTAVFAKIAIEQAKQGIETVAAFAIPKWWLTTVVALGLFDAALHLFRQGLGWSSAVAGHEMDV